MQGQDIQEEEFSDKELIKKEYSIIRKLYKKHLYVKKMDADGNCLFNAVSDQLYGKQDYSSEIRALCCEYLKIEKDYYADYITSNNINTYIQIMAKDGVWGGNIELQALSELYNVKIEIYVWSDEPINTLNEDCSSDNTLRQFYRRKNHYDSIKPLTEIHKGIIKVQFGVIEKESLDLARTRQKGTSLSPEIKDSRLKFERKVKKNLEDALIESQKQLISDTENLEKETIDSSLKEYYKSQDESVMKIIEQNELKQIAENELLQLENNDLREVQEASKQFYINQEKEQLEKILRESENEYMKSNKMVNDSYKKPTWGQVIKEMTDMGYNRENVIQAVNIVGYDHQDIMDFIQKTQFDIKW